MKTLVKNSGGRWCIVEGTLTCGMSIVAYIATHGWVRGCVEYRDKIGYCFMSSKGNIIVALSESLEVRTVEEHDEYKRAGNK